MDRTKELLKRFNTGNLSRKEEIELERLIATGHLSNEEIELYQEVMLQLRDESVEMDTRKLDDRFYRILEKEKKQLQSWHSGTNRKWVWTWAPSLGLAAIAFLLGMMLNFRSSEQPPYEDTMMSQLLAADDASDRIHLVSSTHADHLADKHVIDALLFTLITDESSNVRLAAIDALLPYAHLATVRSGMIKSISHQKSPVVLLHLAEAIQYTGESVKTEEFKRLLDRDLPAPLLHSIEEALPTL